MQTKIKSEFKAMLSDSAGNEFESTGSYTYNSKENNIETWTIDDRDGNAYYSLTDILDSIQENIQNILLAKSNDNNRCTCTCAE